MTVKTAAIICGCSESWVRSACERGIIGDAWSTKKKPKRLTYEVSRGKLAEWLGVPADEIERKEYSIERG